MMKIELDDWQKSILETDGNILLVSGRQVGKSTIISIDAAEYAVKNNRKSIMIISHTERQAYLLFSKVLAYLMDNHKRKIKGGKDRPTKSEIKLTNGSIIRCLPTGLDGTGIRGYTVDRLYPDEAHFIPEGVWSAVTPMLVTTGGIIRAATTPRGRQGYVWEKMANNPDFKVFHISTEKVAEKRKDPQKRWMLEHLKQEKSTMTRVQYAQEYLGEFIGTLGQLFSDDIIKERMQGHRKGAISNNYYLGVDIARMGGDETTFEIIEKRGDNLIHVENIARSMTYTTETIREIIDLNAIYKFEKIGVDDAGLGAGIYDYLLRDDSVKRKIIGLNNAKKSISFGKNSKIRERRKLLKEDMYMNLLALLEKKKLILLNEEAVFFSLKSVQYEISDDGSMKIHGSYTHIAEGLIRACWLANEKVNKLWMRAV